MRRRLIEFLVAVVALTCLPALALAQAAAKPSPATLYGTLNVNFQVTSAKDATNPAQSVSTRNALSVDSSNIGVRGGLTVNDYVGATYQCETSANVDGISSVSPCNRNSRIGVTGSWGTLFYGNWDTPFKAAAYGTKADDPFLNTDVFGYQSIMGSPGFNYRSGGWSTASTTQTKGFDVRASNSVGYWSPAFHGFSAKIQYSANEFKNASGTQNPELFGGVVNYNSPAFGSGDLKAAFSALAAYEQHNDGFALVGLSGAFGATAANTTGTATVPNSTTDSAFRLGAGVGLDWTAGTTTVGFLYDQLTLKQDRAQAGAITEYKRGAWQLALKHRYQDFELRVRYSQAAKGDVTLNGGGGSTDGYGASMLALGAAYYFAPTFQAYLSYAKITNDANAQYTLSIGGSPAVAGNTPAGADPEAIGLGLRYAF